MGTDSAVVAWVCGEPVSETDLDRYVARLGATSVGEQVGLSSPVSVATAGPLRTWALKSLLTETLLRADASRLGVAGPEALLEAVGAEAGGAPPSEEEISGYYRRNPERWSQPERRVVRHVLCEDRDRAELVARRARSGEDLAGLAGEHSCDPGSRHRRGSLGEVTRGELAGPVEEAVFGAEEGTVIGPVGSEWGWHVLVVEEVRPAGREPLDAVRDVIAAELVAERRRRAIGVWFERRLAEGVRVAEGWEHPATRGLPGSPHRH